MAAGTIRVAPDSTGKYIQSFENTINSLAVEAQAVVLVDTSGVPLGATGNPAQPSANNNWAQALSVTDGSTETIISILSTTEGYRLKGFIAHGTGDGYFFLQVDSMTILSGRIRSTLPVLILPLPDGVPLTPASNVTLKVTNESGSTADYEATLLGA